MKPLARTTTLHYYTTDPILNGQGTGEGGKFKAGVWKVGISTWPLVKGRHERDTLSHLGEVAGGGRADAERQGVGVLRVEVQLRDLEDRSLGIKKG